jgi:hypothetical protein
MQTGITVAQNYANFQADMPQGIVRETVYVSPLFGVNTPKLKYGKYMYL